MRTLTWACASLACWLALIHPVLAAVSCETQADQKGLNECGQPKATWEQQLKSQDKNTVEQAKQCEKKYNQRQAFIQTCKRKQEMSQ